LFLNGNSLFGEDGATIKRNQTSGLLEPVNMAILVSTGKSDFCIQNLNIVGGYVSGGFTNPSTPTNGENGHGIVLHNSINVTIENCTIENVWGDCVYIPSGTYYSPGVYVRPSNIVIENCRLTNPLRGCVTTTDCDNLRIVGNTMVKNGNYANATVLIEPNNNIPQTARNIIVTGNKCTSKTAFAVLTSAGSMQEGLDITNVVVSENNVFGTTIFISTSPGARGISVTDNTLRNSPLLTRSETFMDLFVIASCSEVVITGNQMLEADGSSIDVVNTHVNSCKNVVIADNTWQSKLNTANPSDTSVGLVNRLYLVVNNSENINIYSNTFQARPTVDPNGTGVVVFSGETSKDIRFETNIFNEFRALCMQIISSYSGGTLLVNNNTFANATTNTFCVIVSANNDNIFIIDNIFTSGRSNNILLGVGVTKPILGITENRASSKIAFATAIPTTGTWGQGSIVWNINATSAQPAGWMCTIGGTPGTWKALANLA
jgi:hypothetical protein